MKKQYLLDLKQKPFNYVKEEKLHQILMPDESGNTEVYFFVGFFVSFYNRPFKVDMNFVVGDLES